MSAGRERFALTLAAALAVSLPACNEGDTITTPVLSATCTATPSSGPAPLVVSFALDISGAEGTPTVAISYGDGTSGTDPDATHTYGAGVYTASFTVTTTSQTARCATTVTVSAGTGGGPDPDPTPTPGEPTPPPVDGNLAPVASFKTSPDAKNGRITGTAPFDVRFNMCLSDDPEDDTLYFTMDTDGDGKLDVRGSTGASCREDVTYAVGTWKAELCVTDLDAAGARLHEYQCQVYTVVANP